MREITHQQLRDRQEAAFQCVEEAFNQLITACQITCDLKGWADQWHDIGKVADTVQELARRIRHSSPPVGRDGYELVTHTVGLGQTVAITQTSFEL